MLNILFIIFIIGCAVYLVVAPRKEVPLIILLHALFQYAMTLVFWIFHMNTYFAGMLLGFMVLTTFLLIWARGMNYSRELHSIQMFFSLSQWAILIAVIIFISIKSPYFYMFPSSGWNQHINPHQLSIHPAAKLCGNILLFSTFFQLIIGWGRRWTIRKSIIDLGPICIYFAMMGLLRYFQSQVQIFPFS